MKYKVAIIEDDDLIRGMIHINLSKNNYEVYSFSKCEEIGLGKSMRNFDIIVLDIVLQVFQELNF